jgi:hypothetical protein
VLGSDVHEVNPLTVDLDLELRQSAVEHRLLLLPVELIPPANARVGGKVRRTFGCFLLFSAVHQRQGTPRAHQ